jgi:succinate dehydrogenase / fumarate reductase, cytochrome b subunit
MSSAPKPRPKYYDLNLAHLPPPGVVSILHRISGLALFFPLLPAMFFLLEAALGSKAGFEECRQFFSRPLVKLLTLGAIWLYAHHFWAGMRYLLLDIHVGIDKASARTSAIIVLALGIATTLLIGWRIW